MRVYVVCAFLITAVVVVQFALGIAVFAARALDGSLALDRAMPDEGAGLAHQLLGLYVMPVLVTALLIASFDTRFKGATRWAVGVCGLFLGDVALASFGILYGNGFAAAHVLAAVAMAVMCVHAVRRLRTAPPDERWSIDDFT